MKFETKCEKLNISEEVNKILTEAEKNYDFKSKRLVIMSKVRKWEIAEVIGNYFQWESVTGEPVYFESHKRLSTYLKEFGISKDEISYFYALGIANDGYELAYAVNNDVVLILE